MKKIILVFLLFSCSKQNSTVTTQEPAKAESGSKTMSCDESFSFENTNFKMTGYKFLDKTPVEGTFKEWTLEAPQKFSSIEELMSKAKFSFEESSLDFGKVARNKNILGALMNKIPGETISGSISSVDAKTKTATVNLYWGEMEHSIPLTYSYNKGLLSLKGQIDIIAMGFGDAYSSLAKRCKVYHTKDGVSKTWQIVDINISTRLKGEDC